jgi:hypothetical protein
MTPMEKLTRQVERMARASERRRLTGPQDAAAGTTVALLDALLLAAHGAAGTGDHTAIGRVLAQMEGLQE